MFHNFYILVESERLGYLKPIPLVIIKAVPPEVLQKPKEEKKSVDDSSSDDSEDEVPDPLPKLFDDDLGPPVLSRSESSVSIESPGLVFDQRPSSACTDNSDISTGPEFITPLSDTDESQFDVATLTCRICNKTLKNLRTFRNHRARHLGILNHKCPDCSKCFEGRSAVNRHLISNHNRELLPHEITTNPAAAAGANICKPTSGVKIFKPSDMARKPLQSTESPGKVAEIAVPGLSTVTRGEKGKSDDSLFDMVREGKTVVPPASGQMPILLENPAPQPVKYIVGSQLRNDENSCSDTDSLNRFEREDRSQSPDLEEPEEKLDKISPQQPLEKSKEETVTIPEVEKLEETPKETENKETIDPAPVDEPKTLPPEIANMEKIIPESDSDSDSDSSSSSSSSDSDSSSDEGDKENDDKPEEILIDDDDNIPENLIPDSPKKGDQYLDAFQNFIKKSTDNCAKADEERVSSEVIKSSPRRTLTQVIEISPTDDIMPVLSPPELEDQTEDPKSSEKNEPALKPNEKMIETAKVSTGARRKPVSGAKNKVSMVARIFRAKKKDEVKNEAKKSDSIKPKALEKHKKISPRRLRKSSSEDSDRLESESNDDSRQDAEMQAEADKLLEKKGVSVIGGKLMIPADKLKIPDELCKIKLVGKANKRHFCCEICDKSYNRADKMKYHLYNDHYEDFIRCSDSVPRILKKSFPAKLDVKGVPSKTVKEKSVSKPSALARIFKKKEPKKDATPPKRSPRERKISEKDEGSKLPSILVDPGSPVESTSDTMDAHTSDLEDLGRSKLRGKSSPETSKSNLQERSVRSRSRQKSEQTSPARSGKLKSGDNSDRSASPQKNKSPEKSNKKSPMKQERPESPEKLHPSILTDKVKSPEQLEMIKSPEKTSSLRSPDKQDRITLVKLDKLKSPVQSVPINSEEIDQFFESGNNDLEPSILEPVTPILPKPGVQRKRGRKKKSETDIEDLSEDTGKTRTRKGSSFLEPVNFDISSLEGSSRRTRAMSEENLTPPEIIENTSMTPEKWDGSGQMLKSGLRTEFSPRSLVKLKVTFDLPRASYDADGNEIVKEKKKKLVESSPTRFPKSVEEPKFGMNKDFVTFADLALKSKCQVELMEKENSILKPVAIGRKKVSARLSLEQSNIEDTPELTALQAIKEDEKKENEAIENNLPVQIENSTEIQEDKEPITEEKETPVSDEEDEDISDDLPESLKILLGEGSEMKEDESRPTRSKLHVDTIGLNSSTLDLELHALRNLVFNEILKQKYDSGEDQRSESRTSVSAVCTDEIKPCNEVKKDFKNENSLITEVQAIKPLDEEEPLTQFLECIEEDKPLSRVERFIQIGKNFQKAVPKFRSFLWHERKRLRILKSAEFRALRDKQPIEKQKKYKPKRHDYSLEILCKNNLYDNVVFNTREMIEKNFRLTDKVLRSKPFHPIFHRKYSVLMKENELKMILRRKPKSYFSCTADCNELKISLKKEVKEKKAESECKNEVSPVQPKAISEVPQEHEIPKAIPGPKKRGRKPKNFKETAPVEEKINSAEMLIENACAKEENTLEPSPKRARKGRPKKATAPPPALKGMKPQPPLIQPNQEKELDSAGPIGETKSNDTVESGRSFPVKEAHQSQTAHQDIEISSPKLKLVLPVDKSDEMTVENSAKSQELVKIQTAAVSNPSEHTFSAEENRFGRRAKKRKEVLEKTEKIKFKKCKISESLSSDEDQQVPLKITFNRSSKKEDGSINKSIKLRVKTKTTSDHGFNIQIEQPKTDNPVKFKLKTSAELIKRSKRGGKSLEDIAGKLALLSQTKSSEEKDLEISNDEKSGSSKFTKFRISSRNEKSKNPVKAPEVTIQKQKGLIDEPKFRAVDSKISTEEFKVSAEDTKVSVDESKVSIEEPMVPEKKSKVSVSDLVSMNGLEVSVEHSNVSLDKSSVLTDKSKVLAEESKVSEDKSIFSGEDPKISVDVSKVSPEVSKVSEELKILDEESKVSVVESKVLTNESKVLQISKDLFKSKVPIKEVSKKVAELVAKSFKESADEPKVSKDESKVSPEKFKIPADQSETLEPVSEVSPKNSEVSAEESKVSAEESKISAEESEVSAEESKVSAEESKVSAEESKVSAEESEVSTEEPKVSKENTLKEEPMEMKTSISSTAGKSSMETPEINAELSARAAPPAPSGESKQTFSGKRLNKNRI